MTGARDETGTLHECAVCGTEERPEQGWIYRSGDIQPKAIEKDGVLFEAVDGADALCSLDCLDEYKEEA